MPSKASEGFTKNAQAQKFIRNRDQKLKGKEEKKEDHISRVMCEGVCRKCREKAQWRFKYDKYKPLKAPGNCQECRQKKITKAYRTLCDSCASKKRVCSSCCVSLAEAARLDSELESALDAILTAKAVNDNNEKDANESSEEEEEDEDLKITVKPVKSLLSKSLKAVVIAGTAQTNAQNTSQPTSSSEIPTSSSGVVASSITEEENPYADFVFGDFSERKKPKRKEKKQKAVQQQTAKKTDVGITSAEQTNVGEDDGPEEEGEGVWEDAEDGDEENEESGEEEEGSEEEESGDEEQEEGEEGEEEDNSESEDDNEEEESEEEEGSDFFDESVSVADVTQRITTFGVSSSVSVCSEVSINAEIKLMDVAWDERKFTNLAASKYSKNRVVGKEGDNHYR